MIERIKKLMNKRGLTPSQFADEIGLKRSSLSHILSGRNNPSLDVVMKIKSRFEEINTDWLLFGTGTEVVKKEILTAPEVKKEASETKKGDIGQQFLSFETPKKEPSAKVTETQVSDFSQKTAPLAPKSESDSGKAIRLLVIYQDQTFESFESRS